MAERKISEMTLDELKLYEEQLSRELSEVKFYQRNRTSSLKINEEEV